MIRPVLLLGDPRLHTRCREVAGDETRVVEEVGADLRETLLAFRREHGVGRGIAAPQIGVAIRLVYLHWPEPRLLVNPRLDRLSEESFELWDDCMSFPELLVRVRRRRSCRLLYRDPSWAEWELQVEGDLSELCQHEVDHLDGVLAVERAVDSRSFALRRQLAAAGELPCRAAER